MCPEYGILSALIDGEVPEPYASGVRAHVKGCEACAKAMARMERLGALLRESPDPATEQAAERVFLKLVERSRQERKPRIWEQTVRLPVPLAAALGFVAVGLIALSMVTRAPERSTTYAIIPATSAQGTSLVDFKRFMEQYMLDAEDTIEISIPQGSYALYGEPVLMPRSLNP